MNKQKFYEDLNTSTICGWEWCRKLYCYQLTDPAFLERVYARLEELSRDRVKNIYLFYVKTEIYFWSKELKDSGAAEMASRNYKERQVKEWKKKNLQAMTDSELLKKLNDLREKHPWY